jgi:hypothetical protein
MDHLLHRHVVVCWIRCFQFECDQFAANLLVDNLRDAHGVVRSGRYTIRTFFSSCGRWALACACCAEEDRDRRQITPKTISDKTVVRFSFLKASAQSSFRWSWCIASSLSLRRRFDASEMGAQCRHFQSALSQGSLLHFSSPPRVGHPGSGSLFPWKWPSDVSKIVAPQRTCPAERANITADSAILFGAIGRHIGACRVPKGDATEYSQGVEGVISNVAALSTENFVAGVKHMARYKKLTAPEEILYDFDERQFSIGFRWLLSVDSEPQVLTDYCHSWMLTIARHGTGNQRLTPLRVEYLQPRTNLRAIERHSRYVSGVVN